MATRKQAKPEEVVARNGDQVLVPLVVIAQAIDLSVDRCKQLVAQNVIVKVRRDRYDLVASVNSFIRYKGKRGEETGRGEEARTTINEAKARMLLREEQLQASRLMPVSEAVRAYRELLTLLRQGVLAIPSRAAPVVHDAQSVRETRNLIDQECRGALQDLGEELPGWFEKFEKTAAEGEPVAPPAKRRAS